MKRIDPKYSIYVEGGMDCSIVNAAGVEIPEDEPLILFRGRDRLALPMLRHYRELAVKDGCTAFHLRGIDNRIAAFEEFQGRAPERMKQPGITEGK